jgi:hypothetical protein
MGNPVEAIGGRKKELGMVQFLDPKPQYAAIKDENPAVTRKTISRRAA